MKPIQVSDAMERLAEYALEHNLGLQLLDGLEKAILSKYLEQHGGNQCKASQALGMHRNSLLRHMDLLRIPSRYGLPEQRSQR